ncbi:hypothetical protein KAJ83_03610 [Marivibrio halodurans]|uniref:Uncharacterized protein n=1 Tax=Marivibrio halodurans TaxID=2039722 RepID=A0A8J7UZV5_9PROT|nr:hypothetical protein [Marivibrio halodurans]MBP5856081.1 hypothetical protein [Marivibrio halodurans]
MSSANERMFYLMRLAMGRYPAVDASVTIQILIEACEHARKKATDVAWVVGNQVHGDEPGINSSNAIYLADFRQDEKYVYILLVRGDPTVGRPTFANMKKKSVTPATSDDPDAVPAVSALLVIERGVLVSDKGQHRSILERASGLGKVMVRDYLAVLLRRYAKEHPDKFEAQKKVSKKGEKPETIQYSPTVKLHPQQNASLKNDMEQGQIGGFRLMRGEAKYNGPADEAKIVGTNVQLKVKLAPTGNVQDVFKTLKNVKEAMSDAVNFDSYKLDLLDTDDGDNHSTQLLPLETIDNADMRYCRTVKASGFSSELEQCYARFHEEIVDKAKKFFDLGDYWK